MPRRLYLGALALGATRSEALWRVVLPVARPALLTGFVLAVARAAGEVAPLMLVGVVNMAPSLPIDGEFPARIRHGNHAPWAYLSTIATAGSDPILRRGQAYAAALLLVIVVTGLNLTAIPVRNRLRERGRRLSS
ncbi:ABC transporter permease subunit [Paucibacter sp. O1-1]|nr:ABC transporter permease subunit [Paucibacter sp. O1-1]MDA3827937.1 ABC transporter permease subunit [Paucibacter sp. O1-1]